MRLITPGDLLETFPAARSLAVVGNAPTVKQHLHGALIDSHDIVVRFNRVHTAGLEEHIGARTDVLCVNAANSLAMAPPPSTTTKPRLLICFVSPQGARNTDFSAFGEWVGDIPILLSFGPDLIGLLPDVRTRPLTSGTYVLFTLLRLFELNRLFVTGFTMFGAVAGGSGKIYEDKRAGVGDFHDLDQESKVFADTLAQFQGNLTLTPEVRSLVSKVTNSKHPLGETVGVTKSRDSLKQRLASGLSWRLMGAAMQLRRIGEAR